MVLTQNEVRRPPFSHLCLKSCHPTDVASMLCARLLSASLSVIAPLATTLATTLWPTQVGALSLLTATSLLT
jgi:hypothetical protein